MDGKDKVNVVDTLFLVKSSLKANALVECTRYSAKVSLRQLQSFHQFISAWHSPSPQHGSERNMLAIHFDERMFLTLAFVSLVRRQKL